MKKVTLSVFMIGILSFTSCGDDDSSSNCKTCTSTNRITNFINSVEYCDNEDGTLTATTSGGTEIIIDLDGATFNQYIGGKVYFGEDCN